MFPTYIVSNRMPVTITQKADGPVIQKSAGGLVTALGPLHNSSESWWVGSVEGTIEPDSEIAHRLQEQRFLPINIPQDLYNSFYNGACNGAIWPLFHYFPAEAEFRAKDWQSYTAVNELFCEALINKVEHDAFVWVQDYQLMLLPRLLRQRRPDLRIGYFHHIPFPASEVLRLLPWRNEILEGLLGADVVGFHTMEYARHFISSVIRILGYPNSAENIYYTDRIIKVGAFPLGIDTKTISEAMETPDSISMASKLAETYQGKKLIVGVDRLDYTKGIKERLLAYEIFLREHPDLRKDTVLLQLCVPSRVDISYYKSLRAEIERQVSRINGEFGEPGHTPVQYLFQSMPLTELTALYKRADVCLVTPLRDGLNLVCKEYVAAHNDNSGVLILSEFAGAAEEMGEALIVNPYNHVGTAAAIREALLMPQAEREQRMRLLRARVYDFNNETWASSFIEILNEAVEKNRANETRELDMDEVHQISQRILGSQKTLVAFDFDAVFVARTPRFSGPRMVHGAREVIDSFANNPLYDVALVTTLTRHTCNHLFPSGLSCWIAAEDGAFLLAPKAREWHDHGHPDILDQFKPEVMRILNRCARRVPGSIIEEKETAIAWHFRHMASSFANSLGLETSHVLNDMLSKSGFHCQMSRTGLEVKSSRIHKGQALEDIIAMSMLPQSYMVITIGDEKTDEHMFTTKQDKNISINIGAPCVFSHFLVDGYRDFKEISKALASLG